jgi:hypothetical protein
LLRFGSVATPDHSFKKWTGEQTRDAIGSWFSGPTVGSLGAIDGPVIKKKIINFR